MRNFARSLKVIAAAASVGSLALASLVLLAPGAAAGGSFDSLPPGEQKIVRALHEAQPTSSTTVNPLTLDQIAARKGGRQGGWGQVFKAMKAEGFVTQKNLGAVVSSYQHRPSPSSVARADRPGREDGRDNGAARSARDDRDRGSSNPSSTGGGHGHGAGHGGAEAGRPLLPRDLALSPTTLVRCVAFAPPQSDFKNSTRSAFCAAVRFSANSWL